MPAAHLVHALPLLHHPQANRALLTPRAHNLLQRRLDVPLHASSHLHSFHLWEVPSVASHHPQPRSSCPHRRLPLHNQLAHPIKQLHSEVGQPFGQAIARVRPHHQVGTVNPLQFFLLALKGLLVGVASELRAEEKIDLPVHDCFRHFDVGKWI